MRALARRVERGLDRRGMRALAFPALAQRTGALTVTRSSPTLKRIDETAISQARGTGELAAVRIPDAKKQPIGYSLDICEVVVDEIAREVGKALTVEFRPVTPENRIELVRSGAIDLECGSTTNSAERRKVVGFSPTMFVTGTKLLVRRGSSIRYTRATSKARRSCSTRGTVQETSIPKLVERQKLSHQVHLRRRSQRVVPGARVGQGGRLRERRRAALRHAGGNAIAAAIFASSAIS